MKAVIPAAGLGVRFLPLTKEQPKEMLPVVDRPAIHGVVEEAVAAGATDLLIVTGREKRPIEDYFDASPRRDAVLRSNHDVCVHRELEELSARAHVARADDANPCRRSPEGTPKPHGSRNGWSGPTSYDDRSGRKRRRALPHLEPKLFSLPWLSPMTHVARRPRRRNAAAA